MWNDDNSMQNKLIGQKKYRSGIALELASRWWGTPLTGRVKGEIKVNFWRQVRAEYEKMPEQSIEEMEKHLQTDIESSVKSKKEQVLMLVHFLELQQQAQQTFTLNQNINRDTTNIGSFGEYALMSRYDAQIDKSGMFKNPNSIFEKTFVGGIRNSVDLLSHEFATKFFTSRDPRLTDIVQYGVDFFANEDRFITKDARIKGINRWSNFITNFLLQVIPDESGDSQFARASKLLFVDNIPLQLATLRRKYPDNIWLAKIQPLLSQSKKNSAGSMRSYKMNNSLHDINLIVDSALVAYRSTSPELEDLRKFYSDIATYALIQSGGQNIRNIYLLNCG